MSAERVSVRFKDGLVVERDVPPGEARPMETAAYMMVKILQEQAQGRSDWLDEMVTEVVQARHVPSD